MHFFVVTGVRHRRKKDDTKQGQKIAFSSRHMSCDASFFWQLVFVPSLFSAAYRFSLTQEEIINFCQRATLRGVDLSRPFVRRKILAFFIKGNKFFFFVTGELDLRILWQKKKSLLLIFFYLFFFCRIKNWSYRTCS